MSKLCKKRLKAGLSIYKLSKISDVAQSAISDIEAGKTQPYWSTLQRLAAALHCSPHDLDDNSPLRKNIRICPICKQEFRFNPSEDTKTCGNPECLKKHKINISKSDNNLNNLKKAYATFLALPMGQPGPEYVRAKNWVIKAPDGKIYECRNLMHWLREHEEMLDGTVMQAWNGISKIKYTMQGKKNSHTSQWKGWRLLDFGD